MNRDELIASATEAINRGDYRKRNLDWDPATNYAEAIAKLLLAQTMSTGPVDIDTGASAP